MHFEVLEAEVDVSSGFDEVGLAAFDLATGAAVGGLFPGMSAAMDGRRQAHMDVLVAVPGSPTPAAVLAPTVKTKKNHQNQSGCIQICCL
ncbi:hypothetical protein KEHDKFFH_01275 [Marinobacter maroccanus]|uniref:Uncharacterized protein n=1 Tax=Marinobacter maroccanus TaxID=2055143 RepID=A0A2S5ZF88_9GAMM|nr:hypothetical protein KEHDKFFH_01275 [Marinobacter maroccanus]